MIHYIPHKCHRCFNDIILVVRVNEGGVSIASMIGKCLICYRKHILEVVREGMAEIQKNPERKKFPLAPRPS